MTLKITIYGRESELGDNLGDFAIEVVQKTVTYLRTALNAEAIPPKIGTILFALIFFFNSIKIFFILNLDLIALPFFPELSSPSWGLNGFREFDLFFRDGLNSKADRQLTALVIAKEMAHNVMLKIVFIAEILKILI